MNKSPQQTMTQAAQFEAQGQLASAEALYRQILTAIPHFHPAYHALGLLALKVNKLPVAVELLKQAIHLDKSVAQYQSNLCEIYRRLGLLDKAISIGHSAVKTVPGQLDSHYNLALALYDHQDYTQAIEQYRQALQINPQHNLSFNNMGSALEKTGRKNEAEEAYLQAVTIAPQHAEAHNNLGAIYSEQGKLEEAKQCFNAAISANPQLFDAHHNLSTLKTYTKADPHFAALKSFESQAELLAGMTRVRYYFSLAKALHDVKAYADAFKAYQQANQLRHQLLPYQDSDDDSRVEQIRGYFDTDFFEPFKSKTKVPDLPTSFSATVSVQIPIFIVGMPRSGTTLIEQVLASHPDGIYGAGELSDLHEIVQSKIKNKYNADFPQGLSLLSEADFTEMGQDYLQRIRKLAPDARFISDKMPANFFYLGIVKKLFPQAKIIHAMRDPMDSCFSCYTRLFNEDNMAFSYDLETLGRYYVHYKQLMAHWHSVLPYGSILDVHYEDMVSDFETQTQAILDYLQLSWSDDCNEFYKNKRLVKTASIAQVRQPIYTSSLQRWKPFKAQLAPLYSIVKDYR